MLVSGWVAQCNCEKTFYRFFSLSLTHFPSFPFFHERKSHKNKKKEFSQRRLCPPTTFLKLFFLIEYWAPRTRCESRGWLRREAYKDEGKLKKFPPLALLLMRNNYDVYFISKDPETKHGWMGSILFLKSFVHTPSTRPASVRMKGNVFNFLDSRGKGLYRKTPSGKWIFGWKNLFCNNFINKNTFWF